jgi:hypothetical protein
LELLPAAVVVQMDHSKSLPTRYTVLGQPL